MMESCYAVHFRFCKSCRMCFNRYIQSTCATSGEGLYEGLDWLSSNIANKVCKDSLLLFETPKLRIALRYGILVSYINLYALIWLMCECSLFLWMFFLSMRYRLTYLSLDGRRECDKIKFGSSLFSCKSFFASDTELPPLQLTFVLQILLPLCIHSVL